ncbi:outer membrane beta-barrel protein [Phaeocystidibacter marisrubri]|uniref:PorT family protein n=1 Tax=Phaeocystidibacter marisrubri TaxID=1577780 RepID=A0A6L3ZFL5_9FLAO|nr:outer membrane beta-barrel protein [Phaeocystidibacter marisrubri]KAB2816222.1 PorT family protein [Phaeocystidibacter marisrubri]GGH67929.1 hypothetical protein GCM10011318_07440 [Phaeocystidibacter marisrubri]
MKKLLFSLLLPLTVFGQNMSGPEGKFIYDLTYDLLVPSQSVDGLQQEWYSNGHSFSFMGERSFVEGFGFGYGFGFSIHNLHNNLAYVEVDPTSVSMTLLSDSLFNINKQNLSYFDIPLEIRYRGRSTQKGWFFRMSAGVRLGYRLTGSAYHRADDHAIRQYRVFTTSPYRAKVYARVGAGKVTLYAGYDLIPMLQDQNPPPNVPGDFEITKFRMMSVGLSIVL